MNYKSNQWVYFNGIPHLILDYDGYEYNIVSSKNKWETTIVHPDDIDGTVPENQIPTFQLGDHVITDTGEITTIDYVDMTDPYTPYRVPPHRWVTPYNLTKLNY